MTANYWWLRWSRSWLLNRLKISKSVQSIVAGDSVVMFPKSRAIIIFESRLASADSAERRRPRADWSVASRFHSFLGRLTAENTLPASAVMEMSNNSWNVQTRVCVGCGAIRDGRNLDRIVWMVLCGWARWPGWHLVEIKPVEARMERIFTACPHIVIVVVALQIEITIRQIDYLFLFSLPRRELIIDHICCEISLCWLIL